MATVKEIAEKCGISIGTVDRVLHNRGRVSPKTRRLVLATAEELQYVPNRAAQSLAVRKKKLRLAFLAMSAETHPFFADINRAALEKAAQLAEFGVTVTIIYLQVIFDRNRAVICRLPESEGIRLEEFDGIACPFHVPEAEELKRKKPELPIAYYNSVPRSHDGLIAVGCDYHKSGAIAAGLCALAGENKIAIVSEYGSETIPDSFGERLDGFRSRMRERYPELTILDTLFITNNRSEDRKLLEELFAGHPDISAVYLVNPGNYDVCLTIREFDPEHRIRIITNDLVPGQKELIRSGVISATITQEPEKQGSVPLETLFRFLAFGELPDSSAYYTRMDIRIAGNMEPPGTSF